MLIQEQIGNFIKTYSDKGVYIRGGYPEGLYVEATDPAELNRTYEETDIPIETEEEDESVIKEKAEAYDILIGDEK